MSAVILSVAAFDTPYGDVPDVLLRRPERDVHDESAPARDHGRRSKLSRPR